VSSRNEFISLEQAAQRLGIDADGVLLKAEVGEIPIAVYADSWIAEKVTENAADGRVHRTDPPDKGRVLKVTWLYMRAGYLRRFLGLDTGQSIQVGGMFCSQPNGPVDMWIENKPFLSRGHLQVRAADVEQLRTEIAIEAGAEPGYLEKRKAEWQRKANELATELMKTAPAPKREKVAYELLRRGIITGVSQGTIVRALVPEWKHRSRRA
jgi:hypothetical protein